MLQATGGPLKAGERVLVTAAAGATGHIAVQLGLLSGCHIIAVCGNAEKQRRLEGLGLQRVINHRTDVREQANFSQTTNIIDKILLT